MIAPKIAAAQFTRSNGWRRYPGVYCALARNSLSRDMTFKANFIFWIVVELLWFALQLTFNSVIYLQTETIGTWTKWEVVLLIGTSHFIQQIFQALFLVNCNNLSDLVHSGKFDFMLLLPLNTRFLLSCRQIDITGFISAASGLAIVVYAAGELGLAPSGAQIGLYMGLCVVAVLIHYALMFMMASISFWAVRAEGIMMAYYNLFSIARIPDVAFSGPSRLFFTLVVPMLIVSNVPVKVLLERVIDPKAVLLMLVVCGCSLLLSGAIWRRALTRYTSSGS